MTRSIIIIFLSIGLITLGACAGRNFVKPSPDSLLLGETTKKELFKQLGRPEKQNEEIVNGESVEKLVYSYASGLSDAPAFEGITPARALTLYLWKENLVGYNFNSSFQKDSTFFDGETAAKVRKGQPREEIIQMLGPPHGQNIYPINAKKDSDVYIYSYSHLKKLDLNSNPAKAYIFSQKLVVEFDRLGKVSAFSYSSSGEK